MSGEPGGEIMKRQSDTKTTKQLRADVGWHKILKIEAVKRGETIRGLLDEILSNWWMANKEEND